MTAEFISPSDARWHRVLSRVSHDVYHLPEYSALCARHDHGAAMAFYAESNGREFLVPLIRRPLPAEVQFEPAWADAASPYGYPGPLTTDASDRDWVMQSLGALRRLAREHHILTVFLRLHPFRGISHEQAALDRAQLVAHGAVVFVDLTKTPKELWSATRPTHRRHITKLLAAGFTPVIDDWCWYERFLALYRTTMTRVNAAPFYFFPDTYFQELREALGGQVHLVAIVAPDGDLAAAGLFTSACGIVQYHLGATATRFLPVAPSKLMIHTAAQWGPTTGATIMNLGGGRGGRTDSLFDFKAGFSPLHVPFHTVRLITDVPRYTAISQSLQHAAALDDPEFFPIYRASSLQHQAGAIA